MNRKSIGILCLALFVHVSACTGENGPSEMPGSSSSGKSMSTSDFLSLMPVETNILFYANLEEMRKSPIGEELHGHFQSSLDEKDREYVEFVEATGVDFEKDVTEVWVNALATSQHDLGGAIVRGTFDEKRIVDYMKKEHPYDFDEFNYRDHRIYTLRDKEAHVAFFNSETIFVGERDWMQQVIDMSEDGGENVTANPMIAKYLDQVSSNELWGIMDISHMSSEWARDMRAKGSSFKGTQSLENMKSMVFYSTFTDKADMVLRGDFTTDEEADLLAEMLNGFKAMAKLMVADDRDAIDMLNEIKVKTEGPSVQISATIDKAFIDKAREKHSTISESPVKLL